MDTIGEYITIYAGGDWVGDGEIRFRLAQTLDAYTDELEAALIRISYPVDWYSIRGHFSFDILPHTTHELEKLSPPIEITVHSQHQNMDLEEDFLSSINEQVWAQLQTGLEKHQKTLFQRGYISTTPPISARDYWEMIWDPHAQRVKIVDSSSGLGVDVRPTMMGDFSGEQIWKILGFDQFISEPTKLHCLSVIATRAPTVASNTPLLHIYTPNLTRPQLIGDKYRPLLDIVPVLVPAHPETVVVCYEQAEPTYQRVYRGYINDITARVTDNNEHPIPLISGRFSITIHFKKRSHGYG